MSYATIDDAFPDHPKVAALSDKAFRVHVTGICYANRLLTDGFIPLAVAHRWGQKAVNELVLERLWRSIDGGYRIHDFLDWNLSRAQVAARREKSRAAANARWKPEAMRHPSVPQSNGDARRIAKALPSPPHPLPSSSSPVKTSLRERENGQKQRPSDDQMYLVHRLQDLDDRWDSVTPGALVKLNKLYGRPNVNTALGHLWEFKTVPKQSGYALLEVEAAKVAAKP